MSRNRKPRNPQADDDEALAADVHEAMKLMGWTVPESEDDVRRAEQELPASAAPLPGALADPKAVFDGKAACGFADLKTPSFPPDAAGEDHLARAAREGGPIPPEIEERMRRDREQAERESDREQNG
ncbi:MAG TPA: hypothetical protein VMZ50_05905 [Phycisphaerae bacterium]|nr:hypothetical protein [Phycisphaerae bacterium]